MADPLSVAASVVGLLTLAAQISVTVADLTKRTRDAPRECEALQIEVADIGNVLLQLKLLVLGISKPARSRTSLIMVDQVVAILSACVTTFTELDAFVGRLVADQKMGLLDRLRWVSKQTHLTELLSKLHTHKASLTLMLTILSCQKQDDAEDKVDRLCELVESTLKQNELLAQRLAAYEAGDVFTPNRPLIRRIKEFDDPPDYATWEPEGHGFTFEEQLMTSRVYRKVTQEDSDTLSLLSSAGHTGSWSMLSGLSLSELSNIAIVALPIYPSDLHQSNAFDFSKTAGQLDRSEADPAAHRQVNLRSESKSPRRVFGQPIANIFPYAHTSVSLRNASGQAVVYGYLPKIVVYLGAFLKENGKHTKDIFATNGHAGRVSVLETLFDSASSRYGTALDGSVYTVHDAACLLLRYLKSLPEPIIPFALYPSFMNVMHPDSLEEENSGTAEKAKRTDLPRFQWLIQDLPHFNRQLLIYILNLLSVFALFADENAMTTARLVSVFQPALLAARSEMDATEHYAAAEIMAFLVENEEHLLVDSWVALSKNTMPTKS